MQKHKPFRNEAAGEESIAFGERYLKIELRKHSNKTHTNIKRHLVFTS